MQPLSIFVKILPRISDHEAVQVKSNMSVKTSPTIKIKVTFGAKQIIFTINHLIDDFTATFLNHPIDIPVQYLWDSY